MIFGKRATEKYIPKFMGNDQEQEQSVAIIRIISAEQQLEWAESMKDKKPTDLDVLKLALVKLENVYTNEDDLLPVTNAEELVKCPGLQPLVQEIILEFNRLNFYGGDRKNAQ